MSLYKISKRPLVALILSALLFVAIAPATSSAAETPAGIQYEYSPIPSAGDTSDAGAAASGNEAAGTSSGFPLLLIAAIVLVLALFIGLLVLYHRRRGEDAPVIPKPTVPLFVSGAVLIAVLAFGTTGTTAAPTPKAPKGFLGIAPQEGINSTDTTRMSVGGVSAIRIPINWNVVQPTSAPEYDFGLYEPQFYSAAEQNIPVLPVLYGTPPWLARKTTTLPTSSRQISAWKKFVAATVERFGSKGSFWNEPEQAYVNKTPPKNYQLWNEVNFKYFAYPVSAKDYSKLVNAASPVVRSKDPKAKVMLSGLFGRPKGSKKQALPAATFLKQLGKYVKPSKFDSIALHPYAPTTAALESLIKGFRKSANAAGYRSKPINVTEIGWSSGKKTNAFSLGSESAQSKQLTSALGYLIKSRHKYKIQSAYWYSWKDTSPKGVNCNFCYSIGLFKYSKNPDVLKPKKAWDAYVKLTGGTP